MINGGYCSFIIKGCGLNFDEIERTLNLKASKKFIKGEVVSKVIGKNEFDIIRFDEIIDGEHTPNQSLNSIIDVILPFKSYIKTMQKRYVVYLKCFVQSDYAQLNFRISPDVMRKIINLDIDLEVSTLSWGGTEE